MMADKPAHRPLHLCDLVKEDSGPTCPAGLPVPHGTVLTRRTLRSVAVLVLLALLVTGANLLYTAHEVQAVQSSQQAQSALNEQRLCTALAALKLPSGPPSQELHATLAQLNCKG